MRLTVVSGLLLGVLSGPVWARDDIMPPPSAAPRTKVISQRLADGPEGTSAGAKSSRNTASTSRDMTGSAQALDGASLRLGNTELRLAGLIVAPVTTPDGITARTALDRLIEGQSLNCVRRDRERDGRLLVSCTRGDGSDVAAEMLRNGAALYSRSATLPDATVASYRVAEGEAQYNKRGLWASVKSPAAPPPVVTAQPAPVKVAPLPAAPAAAAAKEQAPPPANDNVPAKAAVATVSGYTAPAPTESGSNVGTFVMAGVLIGIMLLGLALFDFLQRRRIRYESELEIQQNRQIVAAAIAGELAAARDVCDTRLQTMAGGGEARWPRLRSYVYQSHVDKIGLMGPYLARQIATIYGQMADFAPGRDEAPASREIVNRNVLTKTLDRLCGYIDTALEGLSYTEASGEIFMPSFQPEYQQQAITDQTNGGGNNPRGGHSKARIVRTQVRARHQQLPRPAAVPQQPQARSKEEIHEAVEEETRAIKEKLAKTHGYNMESKEKPQQPRSAKPGHSRRQRLKQVADMMEKDIAAMAEDMLAADEESRAV
ncbi:MAG: thermonuclease family protein [Bdellovibrionales bacterium]